MYCFSETCHSTCMLLLCFRFWLLRLSSFVSRFGLKRLLNVNHIGFTSRKHAPVLGFFQSHDHMKYSKRGTLWTDLVWKSELLHKCEILEDLLQRLVPEKGDGWETRPLLNICDHMEQCGIGLTPIQEWCLFLLPFTPLSSTWLGSFYEPGDGRILTIVHRAKCPSRM